MPDEKKHPEEPKRLAIPAPPKKKAEIEPKGRLVDIPFRGKTYRALIVDGEIVGWHCSLPRASGSQEWRAACKAAVI